MLNFEKISLKHKQPFEKCVNQDIKLNSISDFNFFYLWNTTDNVEIAFSPDFCIVKGVWGKKTFFYLPSVATVEDFEKVYKLISDYQNGKHFYIAGLSAEIVNNIACIPDNCTISYDRNASDYIYLTQDLIELSGKKFHSKKNFVNSFKNSYKYEFVEYNESYYQEILNLYDNWMSHSEHAVDKKEKIAIMRALADYKELNLKIGLLLVSGKIVAFSVSAISVHNIAQVFFEKADTQYKGVYAMINNLTASTFLNTTTFINREEDMGIEGLRKAKLSYNPTTIYEKYILEYKNEQKRTLQFGFWRRR